MVLPAPPLSNDYDDEVVVGYNDAHEEDEEIYTKKLQESAASKYGYEDAAPDYEEEGEIYTMKLQENEEEEIYGRRLQESAASKYGYEDAAPTTSISNHRTARPRRSSLRNSIGSDDHEARERKQRRRKSGSHTIEVRVRGQDQPIRRSRSIDFNRRVKVQEITPVTEMDHNVSKDDIWLQPHELKEMKAQRRRDIKQYEHVMQRRSNSMDMSMGGGGDRRMTHPYGSDEGGDPTSSPTSVGDDATAAGVGGDDVGECCFRGLERYITVNKRVVKDRRLNAYHAVIMEQAKQEYDGVFNDTAIAALYKAKGSTRQSKHAARIAAVQDANDIESYLMSPQTKKLVVQIQPKSKRGQRPSIYERRRISIG